MTTTTNSRIKILTRTLLCLLFLPILALIIMHIFCKLGIFEKNLCTVQQWLAGGRGNACKKQWKIKQRTVKRFSWTVSGCFFLRAHMCTSRWYSQIFVCFEMSYGKMSKKLEKKKTTPKSKQKTQELVFQIPFQPTVMISVKIWHTTCASCLVFLYIY